MYTPTYHVKSTPNTKCFNPERHRTPSQLAVNVSNIGALIGVPSFNGFLRGVYSTMVCNGAVGGFS